MLLSLLVGLPVMILCLLLQAIVVTRALQIYVSILHRNPRNGGRLVSATLLSMVMLLMLLGNFAQTIVWAALFMVLGEFDSAATALYYSAVNFATLGYGDIVMSDRWRLLGPLEAAHGILMFGLSTAMMTAAVADVMKISRAALRPNPQDEGTSADG